MQHFINGNSLHPPYPSHLNEAVFGMGCFWGAERLLYKKTGVFITASGYSGGHLPNPTYEQVCSGTTDHAEVVKVVFDKTKVSYIELLQLFWENHDPTQLNRQGNDIGSHYRSVIFATSDTQLTRALESKEHFSRALGKTIATHIEKLTTFYFAEEYHQQYLAKNPSGYCGIGGLGVCYPKT